MKQIEDKSVQDDIADAIEAGECTYCPLKHKEHCDWIDGEYAGCHEALMNFFNSEKEENHG